MAKPKKKKCNRCGRVNLLGVRCGCRPVPFQQAKARGGSFAGVKRET